MNRKIAAPPDHDNPEWTAEDFARAKPPGEILPAGIASQFKAFRGEQKAPRKRAISIRLSPEVVEHFQAGGRGWQTRIDETLKAAIHQGEKA